MSTNMDCLTVTHVRHNPFAAVSRAVRKLFHRHETGAPHLLTSHVCASPTLQEFSVDLPTVTIMTPPDDPAPSQLAIAHGGFTALSQTYEHPVYATSGGYVGYPTAHPLRTPEISSEGLLSSLLLLAGVWCIVSRSKP